MPIKEVPQLDPKGQGVFLPYDKFITLWEAAKPKPPAPVIDAPPVAAVLAGFTVTGQTHGDVAELVLDGTATALAKGWSALALPGGLALTDFTPDDRRVVLQRSGDAMQLHLPEPGTYHFSAHLSFPISRDAGGRRTLALVLPVAGAGRLDLLIADSEAEVALDPVVAATTIPGKGGTRVQAVLGGAANLAVAWQPPVQQVAGEALILADHQLRLTVAERSLRYDLAAQLTILRRPIDTITVALPPDTQVLAVEARTLRTWEKTGDSVVLHLHEPVEGPYPVALRLERLLPALAPGASRTVDVAWPLVAGAGRSTGSVAVVQAEGLAVAVERAEGLAQVDPAEIAGGQGAVSAFRFLAPPAASAIAVTRLQSDLRVAVHQLVRLGVEEDLIAVVLQLDVRKAGVFALALDVPAGWELADLSGLSVDDTRLGRPEGGVRRLDIALRGRLLGAGEAVLRFRAPASIPRDAATAAAPIVLPLLQLQGAHQVRGTLAIAGPRSWALASGARSALGGAEAEQVRREGPLATLAHELKEDEDLPLAFTVLGPGAGVTLAATPRARELAVVQEEAVSVAEGRVRSLVTLRGEVRYSAAAAVHVRLPSALDAQVVFGGALLAEHVAGAREGGLTTWELRFQAPVLGPFTLTIDSAQELPALSRRHADLHHRAGRERGRARPAPDARGRGRAQRHHRSHRRQPTASTASPPPTCPPACRARAWSPASRAASPARWRSSWCATIWWRWPTARSRPRATPRCWATTRCCACAATWCWRRAGGRGWTCACPRGPNCSRSPSTATRAVPAGVPTAAWWCRWATATACAASASPSSTSSAWATGASAAAAPRPSPCRTSGPRPRARRARRARGRCRSAGSSACCSCPTASWRTVGPATWNGWPPAATRGRGCSTDSAPPPHRAPPASPRCRVATTA